MSSPTPPTPANPRLRFAVFEVDLATGELTRRGSRIQLHDKSFQILAALLERPGELLTARTCDRGSGATTRSSTSTTISTRRCAS